MRVLTGPVSTTSAVEEEFFRMRLLTLFTIACIAVTAPVALPRSHVVEEIQNYEAAAEYTGLEPADVSAPQEIQLSIFATSARATVDEWLEEVTLEEIEKQKGPELRRDVIHGTVEEQLRAESLLIELADRIADEFPETRSPDDDKLTYSAGKALIFAGRHEIGVRTLLREGYCLRTPAMITLNVLCLYGMTDDESGATIIERHDPRLVKYWEDMAALGMPRGQLVLGQILLDGTGETGNEERGIKLLESSGMGEALMILGARCYEQDDHVTAAKWWRKAAEEHNLAEAWHNLGVVAQEERRFEQAVTCIKKALAADRNYNPARVELGRMYIEGWGVDRNPKLALNLMKVVIRTETDDAGIRAMAEYNLGVATRMLRESPAEELAEKFRKAAGKARAGDPEAMTEVGMMYSNGEGVEPNAAETIRWWRKAADAGHAEAMRCLGVSYQDGKGVEQDTGKAIQWYRRAAAAGSAEAMHNLGRTYGHGLGVEIDGQKAAGWYRKAIEAGNVDAMYSLGAMYTDGKAVPQDYAECVKWYRRAAAEGHVEAMLYLGLRYLVGKGVQQDNEKALAWLTKAAYRGHPSAMMVLAQNYALGDGVARDPEQAYIWTSLAIRCGHLDAYQMREEIARELSPDRKTRADRSVARLFRRIQIK